MVRAQWVLTVDAADSIHDDGAVAMRNGVITAVGPAEEVIAAARAEDPDVVVEVLDGHALIPGLVNSHTHLAMTMFRGYADDRDLQAFLDVVVPAEVRVLDADRVGSATRAAAVESLLAGVTTALDMYFFLDSCRAAASEVGLRLQTGPIFLDGPGPEGWSWEERLADADKWLSNNPATPGWRPVLSPHSTYSVAPGHLADVADLAAQHDAIVHLHASENLGEIELVAALHGRRPLEVLADVGLLREGTILAHAVHLTDSEIAEVARTGTAIAHCPASNLKLASGVARIPELVAAGASVGIGTDGPASSNDLDLFAALRLTALLHKGAGATGIGAGAATLPAVQVLRMATFGGAVAVGLADSIGSLEVGKRADLVAVDLDRPHTQPVYDPASALVYAAGRSDVRHVWAEGRAVVRNGQITTVDTTEVLNELRELRRIVLEG